MQVDSEAIQNEKRESTGGLSRVGLNYLVIAAVCVIIGLAIGKATFEAPPDQAVMVDEAQIRAIIESVLEERDAGAVAEEDSDRFALVDDDPYLGEKDAPIVIVEFSDFFCTYCKRHFDQTFAPLLENYGDHIRYVYRDFARLTPESTPAAAAAQCAFAQGKFWEFHAAFFENQSELGYDFYLKRLRNRNWTSRNIPPALMKAAISTRSILMALTGRSPGCAAHLASSSTGGSSAERSHTASSSA